MKRDSLFGCLALLALAGIAPLCAKWADAEMADEGGATQASAPGSPDIWTPVEPLRSLPPIAGSKSLADIEGQLPAGNIYQNAADPVNWGHEGTHAVNSRVRNQFAGGGQMVNAFYVLGGRACLLREPRFRLSDVAAAVPASKRGPTYQLYLISQQRDWNDRPLYVLDEFSSYINGMTVGDETGQVRRRKDSIDHAIEFLAYAAALVDCIDRLDPGYPDRAKLQQFLEFQEQRIRDVAVRETRPQVVSHDRPQVKPVSDTGEMPLWPIETELIAESNRVRAQHGLRPLRLDPALQQTARRQSWTMTTAGMQHGFTSGWAAENIAAGQPTARDVVRTWLASPGHRANLLGPYTRCGMAGYRRGNGPLFFTQQFAR